MIDRKARASGTVSRSRACSPLSATLGIIVAIAQHLVIEWYVP